VAVNLIEGPEIPVNLQAPLIWALETPGSLQTASLAAAGLVEMQDETMIGVATGQIQSKITKQTFP